MGLFRRDLPAPPGWPPARNATEAHAVWRYAAETDPIGHRVHSFLAALVALTLPISTASSAVSLAVLSGYALLRIWVIWRGVLVAMPTFVMIAAGAWALWTAISISWSPDPAEGWGQFGAARALLLPLLLWPVLDIAPALIGAAVMGVLVQNIVQAGQVLELFGLERGIDGRVGGLLHPIQTGMWCVAAMIWHLTAIFNDRTWWRWLSAIALLAAAAGLVATGSRGPWLAAIFVLPIQCIWLLWRHARSRRQLAAWLTLAIVGVGIALPATSGIWRPRIDEAVREYQRAIDDDVFWTSTGLRVGLTRWGWQIFRRSPFRGAGAGGFREACAELPDFKLARERADLSAHRELVPGYDQAMADGAEITTLLGHRKARAEADRRIRYMLVDHPHNTVLDTLARLGLPGTVLFVALVSAVLYQAFANPIRELYARGMSFVVLAWIIGAQFDSYDLNGTLLGLLMLTATVTLPIRPPLAALWRSTPSTNRAPASR